MDALSLLMLLLIMMIIMMILLLLMLFFFFFFSSFSASPSSSSPTSLNSAPLHILRRAKNDARGIRNSAVRDRRKKGEERVVGLAKISPVHKGHSRDIFHWVSRKSVTQGG